MARLFCYCVTMLSLLLAVSTASAVTVQSESDVLADGSAFLWVEGETFLEGADDPVSGFIKVDKNNPIQSITEVGDPPNEVVKGGLDILPADTNASGGAGVMQALTGGGTATWQVQFALPGTYYLYTHLSLFNRDTNTNYGNEDSFYLPPGFNLNSRSDWIGFEGFDIQGDPKVGDGDRDGYIDGFASFVNVMSAGEVVQHNSTEEDFWDGQFHWIWLQRAGDMDANGGFISFDGQAIRYDVSEAEVGTVMDFQISSREPYNVIDGLLFTTNPELLMQYTQEEMDDLIFGRAANPLAGDFNGDGLLDMLDIDALTQQSASHANNVAYDLNGDALVNEKDVASWARDLRKTWIGDANLDDQFDTSDLVSVLASGTYEQEIPSVWSTGDFDGDGRTTTGDLVAALADGGYELGVRPAVAAVPEPGALSLLALGGMLGLAASRARRT